MGGDLGGAPPGKAPTFLVAALKDPIGANLDRYQIVKGWLDADGKLQEKIYDVAWSGIAKPGADGKLPPVGNTVDVANATWTNTIGAPELITVWKDPDFDPSQRAFYYGRVLEIPTPRWTAYDAKRYGIRPPPGTAMTSRARLHVTGLVHAGALAHTPEKWTPVFRKGYAPTRESARCDREIVMGFRTAMSSRLIRASVFGTIMLPLPLAALACGYHDDVSLARGVLNWVYPDALHVLGAISTAVAERRLPAVALRGGLGIAGYHGTARALDQYAQQLRTSAGVMPTFSLLLIEPMLWTRFVSDGEVHAQVHVSGPQPGELVVISGEEVIRAVANNRLALGEAYRSRLIRLYGTDEQAAAFLTLCKQVGMPRPAQ